MKATHHSHPPYRADIDGLRAIAVLLVVFNHLHTRILGGYVGVDVFFVISGYLISGTMIREMNAGSFSLAGFYERRIRRILPALFAMLSVTAALAFHFFVPSELENFALSMTSALFSASNIFFSHQAGYFAAPNSLKPLLHTWSLAVEEQFYIVFPVFLALLRRWFPGRLKAAIYCAAAITFVLGCVWVRKDPAVAFFFAPLRFWELLLGTIISQGYVFSKMTALQRHAAALCGILLIMVPALRYDAQTPFPGLAALPPCLGAALIIASGEAGLTLVGRFLSLRPVAFVGLISYSLYLWHWPILVFQRTGYMLLDAPPDSKSVKVVVFLVSFVVAIVSWRLIERPMRQGRLRPSRTKLFATTGTGFASLLALALVVRQSHGFAGRFPVDAIKVDAYTNFDPASSFRQGTCFLESGNTFADFDKASCLASDLPGTNARPQYLILGDSHAAQLYYGLSAAFPKINFAQATAASCRPFRDRIDDGGTCANLMKYIFGNVILSKPPSVVLIGGHWEERDMDELGETIRWLQDNRQKVIVFGPVMEFTEPMPRLLVMALKNHDLQAVERHQDKARPLLDQGMATLAANVWHVPYISAFQDLCDLPAGRSSPSKLEGSRCPLYAAPDVPLLFDTNHLTPEGSLLYAEAIRSRKQLP